MVTEPGTEIAQQAYREADGVRTTAIAHIEAVSALARMRKGGRLSAAQMRARLDELDRLWESLYVHAVSDTLLQRAAESAVGHALRAYDAVHLAGALSFRQGEDLGFACWDRELREAAGEHGFALVPEQF